MDKDIFIIIGNNIKRYRLLKKYTIQDLSLMTNINADIIMNYEKHGVDGDLTFDELNKICKALEINI